MLGDEIIGLARGNSGDGLGDPGFGLGDIAMGRRRPVPHRLRIAEDEMKRRDVLGAEAAQVQSRGGDGVRICLQRRNGAISWGIGRSGGI